MTVFAQTYLPLLFVLKNGGSMNLLELSNKLNEESQRHFRDLPHVERSIQEYSGCLKINADVVSFNRMAKSYTKSWLDEREVSRLLHDHLPNMKNFELYPHKAPDNSPVCPMGIPWRFIPRDNAAEKRGTDCYDKCDYRGEQREGCRAGCKVKSTIFKKFHK